MALLHRDWSPKSLHQHASKAVGPRRRWLKPLLERVQRAHPQPPRFKQLVQTIVADEQLREVQRKHLNRHGIVLEPATYFSFPARMQPAATPLRRAVPILETPARLAGWLGIPNERLDWYADRKDLNGRADENLGHYQYRWLPKRSANAFRLIEIPKPILKSIQQQILIDILGCLAPHDAAHGFRTGRSIATNAAGHCGQPIVFRFDLQDFFQSIPAAKVSAIFESLGYPLTITRMLAALCTTRLPGRIWNSRPGVSSDRDEETRLKLSARHLPQGAPTSPALANLCALRLDYRFSALANRLGACYTRYADDMIFSGPSTLSVAGLKRAVLNICTEEGFALNPRKTRIQRQSSRQMVTGVVVNVRPNIKRVDYDRLKAILTNCARIGPQTQNRGSHPDFRTYLSGRIAFVAMINRSRGNKLWGIFDRINWNDRQVKLCE